MVLRKTSEGQVSILLNMGYSRLRCLYRSRTISVCSTKRQRKRRRRHSVFTQDSTPFCYPVEYVLQVASSIQTSPFCIYPWCVYVCTCTDRYMGLKFNSSSEWLTSIIMQIYNSLVCHRHARGECI